MSNSSLSHEILLFIEANSEASDGLQDIIFGNRRISLIIIFLCFNLILLSIFYLSKSIIGLGVLFACAMIVFPICKPIIADKVNYFLTHPIKNEMNWTKNKVKILSNEEFAAAISTIIGVMKIKPLVALMNLSFMKCFVGFRMIIAVLIITALIVSLGLTFSIVLSNAVLVGFIYLVKLLCLK